MFKPFALFVGLRYTKARRKNHFISFTALVSMIGLILGVAVLITVMSVMNGFDRELKNRVLGMIPQATVSANELITDWPLLVDLAQKQPHVLGAAPFIQLQGMLTANGQVAGVGISGIDPRYEPRVSIVQNFMAQGRLESLQSGSFNIVLGKGLADQLGVTTGDKVTLVLPEASASVAGVTPRLKRMTISGIFSVGAEVDGALAYMAMNDAARMLRLPDGAQGVRLKVDDLFAAPETARKLASQLPPQYLASDWTQTQGNLFNAIKMEKAMVSLLLSLIILVAAFNIISSLVMLVTEKKADIAILRTLGATPGDITLIFMIQGMLIGVIGTLIGAALGVISALGISPLLSAIERAFNLHLFDAYFINYLPSQLEWDDVLTIVIGSLIVSLLATIYPALTASRIQPAEALRYE